MAYINCDFDKFLVAKYTVENPCIVRECPSTCIEDGDGAGSSKTGIVIIAVVGVCLLVLEFWWIVVRLKGGKGGSKDNGNSSLGEEYSYSDESFADDVITIDDLSLASSARDPEPARRAPRFSLSGDMLEGIFRQSLQNNQSGSNSAPYDDREQSVRRSQPQGQLRSSHHDRGSSRRSSHNRRRSKSPDRKLKSERSSSTKRSQSLSRKSSSHHKPRSRSSDRKWKNDDDTGSRPRNRSRSSDRKWKNDDDTGSRTRNRAPNLDRTLQSANKSSPRPRRRSRSPDRNLHKSSRRSESDDSVLVIDVASESDVSVWESDIHD
jgi:hypothetical protein